MVRNPTQKVPEEIEIKEEPINNKETQIVEREITLSLINEKLNYIIGLLHKVADACEIKN